MTWSAVGAGVNTATATISFNPVSVGDLFICSVASHSATVWATGITGSNITWVQAGVKFLGTTTAFYCCVFLGTATATGSSVNTIAFSGTTPVFSGWTQEFSSTVGSWAMDGSQGNLDANTATCPSLTPSQAGDLYFLYARDNGTSTSGSTPGYVYGVDGGAGNGWCYNLSCTAAAQAPAFGAADIRVGIAILVEEVISGVGTGPNYATSAADLGDGSGSWANPDNADNAPDSAYATWTIP